MAVGPASSESSQQEALHVLYPIFKREVYDRREAMFRIARMGSVTLLFLLTSLLFLNPPLSPLAKGLLACGILLFSGLCLYQLSLQQRRHNEAKRQLISLEELLRMFSGGSANAGVYPSHWRHPPPNWILRGFTTVLIGLALLNVVAVLWV